MLCRHSISKGAMPAPGRIAPIFVILGLAAISTVAVVAIVLSASDTGIPSDNPKRVPVPMIERRATPSPVAAPAGDCQATVGGASAAAVETAIAEAGPGTVCFPAGRYQGPFAAVVAGQTWRLDAEAVLAGSMAIEAPDAWISGGTVELPTDNPWAEGIAVNADRVTIKGVTFQGGGLVISVKGRDGTQILDNHFSGQSGTAIFIWGEGRGADDTLIEGNTIDQGAATKASPVSSRAAEDAATGIVNQRITVRRNSIDQGDALTGWFGVELKLSPGAVIVDNDIRGGHVLISLPDSDGAIVSGNRLDLRGSANWGIEVASSNDVAIEDNIFTGDGAGSEDTAVSMNSGSLRVLISANRASGFGALVNLTGNDHLIADNCLADVNQVLAYRSSAGPKVTAVRNGPCP
jgi:nitrous oxidase accessory protein NosD